jgi:hypothetical protein
VGRVGIQRKSDGCYTLTRGVCPLLLFIIFLSVFLSLYDNTLRLFTQGLVLKRDRISEMRDPLSQSISYLRVCDPLTCLHQKEKSFLPVCDLFFYTVGFFPYSVVSVPSVCFPKIWSWRETGSVRWVITCRIVSGICVCDPLPFRQQRVCVPRPCHQSVFVCRVPRLFPSVLPVRHSQNSGFPRKTILHLLVSVVWVSVKVLGTGHVHQCKSDGYWVEGVWRGGTEVRDELFWRGVRDEVRRRRRHVSV